MGAKVGRSLARITRAPAQRLAEINAGVVAFSRTGDPASGEFGEAQIIAMFGSTDVSLLVK